LWPADAEGAARSLSQDIVLLSHGALKGRGRLTVKNDAQEVERARSDEAGRMRARFNRGADANAIQHHKEMIQVVSRYLPGQTRPDPQTLAGRMPKDRGREIEEFTREPGLT